MKDATFLIILSVLGLIVGFSAYQLIPQQHNSSEDLYCESIEEGIRENRSISGPIDCFEPSSSFEQNDSSVENSTELECLCQYNVNGEQRTFAVRRTQ